MFELKDQILARVCDCDKIPTTQSLIFEAVVIAGSIATLLFLSKIIKGVPKKFLISALGIFIFEFFTAPMWNNSHLGEWAYVYSDVSWVLTLGWATLILATITVVDKIFLKTSEWIKFAYYILFLTLEVLVLEAIVLNIGIRSYTPETLEVINNLYIPFINVPVQALYYIPAFTALVVAFYKFWNFKLENEPLVPTKKGNWLRNLIISVFAVVSFELMIDPMVTNAKLPTWSYFYRDLSFIMTGFWIAVIWLSIGIVDKLFIQYDAAKKFTIYLAVATMLVIPVEAFLISNGFRIYGPTATQSFTGFKMILSGLPIEVAVAIPLYLSLVMAFVKYWQTILDNKK